MRPEEIAQVVSLCRARAGLKLAPDKTYLMESRLAAKKAADWRKTPPKVPHVQKPGIAGAARGNNPDAELESQFAKNPTLKNAQRLYTARSNRKG